MKFYSTSHDYSGRKRKTPKVKGEVYGKYKAPEFSPMSTSKFSSYSDIRLAEAKQFKSSESYCGGDATAKIEPQRYTGTLVKGISTLHKSNAVPILSTDEAKEHARMRR